MIDFVPEGRSTIAQRVIAGIADPREGVRPVGTVEAPGTHRISSVPTGRQSVAAFCHPAMNRWAILKCPSGAASHCLNSIAGRY